MESVIKELHKLRVLHIVEHVNREEIDIGEPLENANKLSEILVRIRSIASYLNVDKKAEVKEFKLRKDYYDLDKVSKNLISEVNKNSGGLKLIEDKIGKNNNLIEQLNALKPLKLPLDAFGSYKSINYFVGYLKDIDGFEKELRGITDKYGLYKAEEKKKLVALFVEQGKIEEVLDLLRKFDFTEFNISEVKGLERDIEQKLRWLEKENSKLAEEKGRVNKQLEKLRNEWQSYLVFGEKFLVKELERAEVPLKFASTKNVFVVSGWVPTNNLDEVKKRLNQITKEKIFIQTEIVTEKDNVPVKLNNPKAVQPFEFFINLYSLPSYKEFDPTFFIFLIFPLMFGFMLGDMGYGVVTLIVALLLRKKLPKAKMFFDIFIFSSVATIFFGMLFGEFFGEEVLFGVELPHILSRAHSTDILLAVSIIIGIVHLLMGLIIGFFDVYKEHGLKHAIYEKAGWILLFPFLIRIILMLNLIKGGLGKAIEFMLPHDYVIIALVLVGVVLIFLGEGVKGLIELPSIFSNILSYGRLMAISIASVMLAIIINDMAKELFHGGIFMILMGILLLVVGHTINIAIGWLGCFLQSLRLHYVEFFTKFFKGGAQPYKPFGVTN